MWSGILFLGGILGFSLWMYSAGKKSQQAKDLKGKLKNAKKSQKIRASKRTPAESKRLRNKFKLP